MPGVFTTGSKGSMTEDTKATRRVTVRCQFCLTQNRVDLARASEGPRCGECSRPILLDRPVKIGDDDLQALLGASEVPILIDFHADWCGPCKIMAPVLDDLARDRMGELLVAKLDTDANPGASQRFGIRGIPTLILFRDGEEVARQTGAVPREQLDSILAAEGT